jgi:hypothetical protein
MAITKEKIVGRHTRLNNFLPTAMHKTGVMQDEEYFKKLWSRFDFQHYQIF